MSHFNWNTSMILEKEEILIIYKILIEKEEEQKIKNIIEKIEEQFSDECGDIKDEKGIRSWD